MLYAFLRATVVRPIFFAFFHITVVGLDNVPKRGPVIVASNHLHFVDSLFIPSIVKRKMTYLVGSDYYAKKSFGGRMLAWFLNEIGQLPIDRRGGSAARAALDTGLQVLSENGCIGIYPEGTRSKDGLMHRGRTGVARLALASGVPVVPCAIQGTDLIQVKGKRFPQRARIVLTFGESLRFDDADGDVDAQRLRAVTDDVMHAVASMTPQRYVDAYPAAP